MRSPLLVSAASVLIVAASALTGCAALDPGKPVTEERSVTDVAAVELDTDGDLTVRVGATPSLTMTAGAHIIDRLTAEVDDGVLRLGMTGEPMLRNGDIRYELTVTSLESIAVVGSGDASVDFSGAVAPIVSVRGSGDVEARGIDASEVQLTVDGSGGIEVSDVQVETLTVRVDGSGGVTIDGAAEAQRVELNGDGSYDAAGLRSARAMVTVHGAGSASVNVDDALDAVIDGSGDISYVGDPVVSEDVSGSGEIERG